MPDAPTVQFDSRFSRPPAEAASWPETESLLTAAELYWLTTVRADGRPHVTPLVGLWHDHAFWFTTGVGEQKQRNLEHANQVAVTTGANGWKSGTDVVVEGTATRATGGDLMRTLAESYLAKYGDDWRFEPGEDTLSEPDHPSWVYRVGPVKVLCFAKDPHGQTSFRF